MIMRSLFKGQPRKLITGIKKIVTRVWSEKEDA